MIKLWFLFEQVKLTMVVSIMLGFLINYCTVIMLFIIINLSVIVIRLVIYFIEFVWNVYKINHLKKRFLTSIFFKICI